jgi:SAM-dependent methyltransferase
MIKVASYLSYQVNFPTNKLAGSKHLDLGSGSNVRNPFGADFLYGTDLTITEQIISGNISLMPADLTKQLPFESDFFDSVSAFDLLEHIPRWERDSNGNIAYPFVNLMSEIARILKPDGFFVAVTPAFPAPEAFQDPTHINFISENTIDYFLGEFPHATKVGYGFQGNFKKLHQSWLRGSGPFEALEHRLEPGFKGFKQMRDFTRLLNRSRKIIGFRRKSHLLWVIQAIK